MAVRHYLRILTPPKGSFLLYGVRGVGKSTWARETFPDAHIIDLLDESRYQSFAANPALLGLELRTLQANRVVVLDEVQRVPALLNEVHRAIEGTRRRFVLLGSSARRLNTADTNLLAGRAALRTMYPLAPAELGADFDLGRVLRFGSIPVVWQADDPRAALEAYVQLYVRAHNGTSELFEEASYWAPAQARQTEVDFLLRRGREFLAIEVKAQPRFSTSQLAGLRAIAELPRLARRILVYLVERQLRTEDG